MGVIGTAYAIKSYNVAPPGFVVVTAPIDCDTFSIRPIGGAVTIFTDTNDDGDTIAEGTQETVMTKTAISPRFKAGAQMFGLKSTTSVTVKVKFLL